VEMEYYSVLSDVSDGLLVSVCWLDVELAW